MEMSGVATGVQVEMPEALIYYHLDATLAALAQARVCRMSRLPLSLQRRNFTITERQRISW